MNTSFLGATGVEISKIGFGSWGVGGRTAGLTSYGDTDDDVSCNALERAYEKGITFYDTSPAYGDGHSEELIGRVFSNSKRSKVILATKGGCDSFARGFDFSVDSLRHGLEQSLDRLRTDYVDLFQLHNPPIETMRRGDEILRLIEQMKQEGKIRAFGVSVKDPEEIKIAIECFRPDAVQVNFNLMDQRLIDSGMMQECRDHNVSIIARTPLCFGFLSGKIARDQVFPDGDHRARWSRAQIVRWVEGAEQMKAISEKSGESSVYEMALKFVLSYREVATTIPGMLTSVEVDSNAAAGYKDSLSDHVIREIREEYLGQSYFVP